MLKKIISGGQTGADQGGLEAGRILGILTGGTAPLGCRTELGDQTALLRDTYNLVPNFSRRNSYLSKNFNQGRPQMEDLVKKKFNW